MVEAADKTGTAATPETVRALGEESLFGDAITLGAVSFYDFLKKENAGKKVFVCNGSACLVAGTQEKLHHALGGHFKEEEIGHICCLGGATKAGRFSLKGGTFPGNRRPTSGNSFPAAKVTLRIAMPLSRTCSPPNSPRHFPAWRNTSRRSGSC